MATTTPLSGLASRNPWARLLQGLVSGASLFTDGVVSGREAEEKRRDSELARRSKELDNRTKEAELKAKESPKKPGAASGVDATWLGFPRPSLGPGLETPVVPDPTKPEAEPAAAKVGFAPGERRRVGSFQQTPGLIPALFAPEPAGAPRISGAAVSMASPAPAMRGRRRPVTPAGYAALVRNGVTQYAEHVGRPATATERRDIEALIAQKISAGQLT
ncbi:MAG: hypothetical protein ACO1SX_20110 [Actinomycetota bacterium]